MGAFYLVFAPTELSAAGRDTTCRSGYANSRAAEQQDQGPVHYRGHLDLQWHATLSIEGFDAIDVVAADKTAHLHGQGSVREDACPSKDRSAPATGSYPTPTSARRAAIPSAKAMRSIAIASLIFCISA